MTNEVEHPFRALATCVSPLEEFYSCPLHLLNGAASIFVISVHLLEKTHNVTSTENLFLFLFETGLM